MAEPTDPGPVADDPELTVNLTRLLNIRGPLGLLKVLDTVVPVVSLGNVVQPIVEINQPAFRSTDVFSNGVLVAPAAGTVLADTGQLAAGTFDVQYYVSAMDFLGTRQLDFEHRNAANAANLAIWSFLFFNAVENQTKQWGPFNMGYEVALNERLRIVVGAVAIGAAIPVVATIFARRRT